MSGSRFLTHPLLSPLRRLYRAALQGGRGLLNRLGLNVDRAGDYDSPLPVLAGLAANRARWDRPSALVGVARDLDAMERLLGRLAATHGEEVPRLPPFAELKRERLGPGFTEVDAVLAYWMVRDQRPSRIVEVGSGLSTRVLAFAAARNGAEGAPCEMRCIDPFGKAAALAALGVELIREEVQALPVDWFSWLGPGDLLFIDSSHVVRIDGAVPFLHLEVVPRLPVGALVHVHDVHFPFVTPFPAEAYLFRAKWPRYWTEAMLLQAFLAFNASFAIVLSAALLRFHREAALAAAIPGYRGVDPADHDTHAGSIWLRRER